MLELSHSAKKVGETVSKGHKTCPTCKLETGPRKKVCDGCGHEFAFNDEASPQETFYPIGGLNILAPAGPCPVKFHGDVREWAGVLIDEWPSLDKMGNKLTPTALRYWLRQEVNNGPEFPQLAAELTQFIGA